jgi:hypothetical protein
MNAIEQLLAVASAYEQATGLEPTTVSWRVFGDSKKLAAIRAGADIQVRRHEKAMHWFAENWPEGAEWPEGILRPDLTGPALSDEHSGAPEDAA